MPKEEKKEYTISEKNIAKFTEVRKPLELDLVDIVGRFLNDFVSEEAKNNFLSDININTVKLATAGVQRVSINRYFTTKFLVFKARTGVPVMDMLLYLINDGDTEDWVELFRTFVLPFIKQHNVL